MRLSQHVKYTTILSVILLPFWNIEQIFLFAIGSVLIDIDHYIFYILRFKRFDLKGMFEYYEGWLPSVKDKIPYAGICIFHTIEIYLILIVSAAYISGVLYLVVGLAFHQALDLIALKRSNSLFKRSYSIIEHFIRVKRCKRLGYPTYDPILHESERFTLPYN
jgi:hypothetical protein